MDLLTSSNFGHTTDWEALDALNNLSPPTPSTSLLSDLSSYCSIGEIPIILHPGIDVGSSPQIESAPFQLPPGLILPTISDDTCGTFGPITGGEVIPAISSTDSDAMDAEARALFTAQDSLHCSAPSPLGNFLAVHPSPTMKRFSKLSKFTVSAYLEPEMCLSLSQTSPRSPTTLSRFGTPNITYSSNLGPSSTNAPSWDSLACIRSQSALSISESSDTFRPDSPSPSPSRSHIDWEATIASAALARKARWFPDCDANGCLTPPPGSPKSCYGDAGGQGCSTLGNHSVALSTSVANIGLPQVETVLNLKRGHPIAPTSSGSSRSFRVSNLPQGPAWLQDSKVQIWIEQEQFNREKSYMAMAEYIPPPNGSSELWDVLTEGAVEFKPSVRQAFAFQCGSLDYLPILKRITNHGDDAQDYISRQASLSLKSNGVYAVCGSEPLGIPSPHGTPSRKANHPRDARKLKWRFEYLVTDTKILGAQGSPRQHPHQSEKTLTPLSFSCSPGLLHPSHTHAHAHMRGNGVNTSGKNTRGWMFDLFRKSLFIPKLIAEKVEAPKPPKARIAPGLNRSHLANHIGDPPTQLATSSIRPIATGIASAGTANSQQGQETGLGAGDKTPVGIFRHALLFNYHLSPHKQRPHGYRQGEHGTSGKTVCTEEDQVTGRRFGLGEQGKSLVAATLTSKPKSLHRRYHSSAADLVLKPSPGPDSPHRRRPPLALLPPRQRDDQDTDELGPQDDRTILGMNSVHPLPITRRRGMQKVPRNRAASIDMLEQVLYQSDVATKRSSRTYLDDAGILLPHKHGRVARSSDSSSRPCRPVIGTTTARTSQVEGAQAQRKEKIEQLSGVADLRTDRRRSLTAPNLLSPNPTRYILPPEELNALLSSSAGDPSPGFHSGVTALKPPTYHTITRIHQQAKVRPVRR